MVDANPEGDFAALEAPVTGFDVLTGFASLTALDAFSTYDAVIDPGSSCHEILHLRPPKRFEEYCRWPAHITAQRESR